MKVRYCRQKRGDIYDKNGISWPLAIKFRCDLDCKTVNSDEDYVEPDDSGVKRSVGI